MEHQELDHLAHLSDGDSDGDVLFRRRALKRLAGGAIAGALILSGCTPGQNTPTPVATSTPSPAWTPTPASSGNVRRDDTPTASSSEPTRDA